MHDIVSNCSRSFVALVNAADVENDPNLEAAFGHRHPAPFLLCLGPCVHSQTVDGELWICAFAFIHNYLNRHMDALLHA